MKQYLSFIIPMCLFFLIGCNNLSVTREDYSPLIANGIGVVLKEQANNTPVVPTLKYKRSQCPDCKGTGIMVHGDGHSSVCPSCEPDPRMGSAKCCPDCICEDCQCKYPGECLVKKNNGWPVTICDGESCRKYFPRDAEGNIYDPCDMVRANPKKYAHLQKYLPENQTKTNTYSGGCSTCR